MSFWIVFVLTVKFGIYFLILKILKNACRTDPIAPSVKILSKGPVENLTYPYASSSVSGMGCRLQKSKLEGFASLQVRHPRQ